MKGHVCLHICVFYNSNFSPPEHADVMDLFGGADDISSGSDGEDKPPTPGQPIVSRLTSEVMKPLFHFEIWNVSGV